MVMFDDILEFLGFLVKKVVMKIDVEGYENRVFKSGNKFFECVDVIVVFMEWMWLKIGFVGLEIVEFFKCYNYEVIVFIDRCVLFID